MHEVAVPAQPPSGNVVLVEDDAAVRASLKLMLELHGYGIQAFASAEDFLAARVQVRPACALIDIRLPGMSGLALQARIGRSDATLPVLLMTAQGDAAVTRAALLQGAIDVLDKPVDEGQLLAAISSALRLAATRTAAHDERAALLARFAGLSLHERRLFDLLTNGLALRDIARERGVSPDALEVEVAALLGKLAASRVADLIRMRFRLAELVQGSGAGD